MTSLTDDPLDNPANAAISDTSIKDNNDAISEKSIDNDDHTDNDDPIPIDEIEEPLTPINNSDASDTSSNFDDAPLNRIIDRYPDPFPFSLTPFLPQRMLTNFSNSNFTSFVIATLKISVITLV